MHTRPVREALRAGPRTLPVVPRHATTDDAVQAGDPRDLPDPQAAARMDDALQPAPGTTVTLELDLTLEEVERRYLSAHLERGGRDLAATAAGLGISRKTLWEKRRRYGL